VAEFAAVTGREVEVAVAGARAGRSDGVFRRSCTILGCSTTICSIIRAVLVEISSQS